MRTLNVLLSVLVLSLFVTHSAFGATPIRVVCVGNSITEGVGATDAAHSYPGQLQTLLGSKYSVLNCGVSGRTMLKRGDFPYWNEAKFTTAKNYNPDIVIISLGTNDSKGFNWVYKNDFFTDYTAMVNEFRKDGKNPQIFVCFPPPAFIDNYSITDSVIRKQINPLVDSLRVKMGTSKIDYYYPLMPYGNTFPDGIHPNNDGALLMAKIAYKTLTQRLTLSYISSPVSGFSRTASETVRVKVCNNKNLPLSNVPVTYKLDDNTEVREIIPLIPAQGEVQYQFTQKTDLSQFREYNLSIYSGVDSLKNDTLKVKIKSVEPFEDKSMIFTGGNVKVTVPNSASLNSNKAFTVEAWIYPTAFRSNIWEGSVISKEGNALGFALDVGGNGQARIVIGTGSAWPEAQTPTKSITLNKWTHIAGVYNGTTIRFFVDGVLRATTKTSAYKISSTPMLIGASSAFGGRDFIGGIDEVRVWNRALSDADLSFNRNYLLRGNEEGLVAYYNFNVDPNTSLLSDQSGHGNSGAIQNWNLGFNWMQGPALPVNPNVSLPKTPEALGIRVYPSPSSDFFQVCLNSGVSEARLEMTDMLGRKVLDRIIGNGIETRVDVQGLPRGMYLLSFKVGKEKSSTKIVLR